jgi:chromosome segregation ATPase
LTALRAAQETQLARLESCASRESESKDLEIAALHAEMAERTPRKAAEARLESLQQELQQELQQRKAAEARLESLRFSLKELEDAQNSTLLELDDTRNRLQHFQGAGAAGCIHS